MLYIIKKKLMKLLIKRGKGCKSKLFIYNGYQYLDRVMPVIESTRVLISAYLMLFHSRFKTGVSSLLRGGEIGRRHTSWPKLSHRHFTEFRSGLFCGHIINA